MNGRQHRPRYSAFVDRPGNQEAVTLSPVDVIAPHVVISRAYTPSSVAPKSVVWLGASARDNRFLTSVTWSVNGVALSSSQCTNPMTEAANQTVYPQWNTPEYLCPWTAPSRTGPVTVKVISIDAAGNTSSDSMTVTVG